MSGDRFADDFPADWENDPLAADERLADYVDDQLDERDRERFEAELRVSARLREQLEQYQRTVATVQRALRAPTQPTQLGDRVMAALASEATRPSLVRRKLRPFLFAVASAAALLALALVVDRLGAPAPSQRVDFASTPTEAAEEGAETGGWAGRSDEKVGDGAPIGQPTQETAVVGPPSAKSLVDELEHLEAEESKDARRDPVDGNRSAEPAEQPNLLRLEELRGGADDAAPVASPRPGEDDTRDVQADADKAAKAGERARVRGGRGAPQPKSKAEPSVAPDSPANPPVTVAPTVGAGGGDSNESMLPGGGGGGDPASRSVKPGAPAGPSTGGPAGPVTGGPGSGRSLGGGAGGPGAPAPEPTTVEGAGPAPGAVRKLPDDHEGAEGNDQEGAKGINDRAVSRRVAGLGESKEVLRQSKSDTDQVGDEHEPAKKPLPLDVVTSLPRMAVRGERADRMPVVIIELQGTIDAAEVALREKALNDLLRGQETPSRQEEVAPQAGRSGEGAKSAPMAPAEQLAGFVAGESLALDKAKAGAEIDAFFMAPAVAPRRIGGLLLKPFVDAPAQAQGAAGAASRDWLVSGSRTELEQLMREVARFAAARGGRLSTGEVGVVGASDVAADAALPAETPDRGGAVEPRRGMVLRFRHQ